MLKALLTASASQSTTAKYFHCLIYHESMYGTYFFPLMKARAQAAESQREYWRQQKLRYRPSRRAARASVILIPENCYNPL